MDFIACNIIFLAALALLYLRKQITAPDIFGYVSSLTRHSPYMSLPDTGTTLSGLKRAGLMKHVKVRIVDIAGSDGDGHVGLSCAEQEKL